MFLFQGRHRLVFAVGAGGENRPVALGGERTIRRYESAPGSFRSFCPTCGSLVPGQAPYLATVSVPAGLLESDPGVRPRLHVFTSSKAPWWEINDELPQHARWVPGYAPKGSTG